MESLFLSIPFCIGIIVAISMIVLAIVHFTEFTKKNSFKSRLHELEIKTATLNCEKNMLLSKIKELQAKISLLEACKQKK